MKFFAIKAATGVTVQSVRDEDIALFTEGRVFKRLEPGESTLAHRYGIDNDTIIDMHPGKTDQEVEEITLAENAARAIELSADFKLSPNDFLRFLGGQRRIAVRALAKSGDPVAEDMLDMFNRSGVIESKDADLNFALGYFSALPTDRFGNGAVNPFVGVVEEFATNGMNFTK
jgi:hypothetical protein